MNKIACLFIFGGISLFLGCTMAPKYTRPAAPVPAAWPTGPAYVQADSGTNAPFAADLAWQSFFADGRLREIIGTALTNNLDLRAAALNVELARGLYGVQRSTLLPSVGANAGDSRAGTPADLSSTGKRITGSRYDMNLGVAAWEIDFFGRLRSLKDQALQEYLASEQARRGAQVMLIASIANAYLALAADRESLQLAETTLDAQTSSYTLIKRRFQTGLVTELDLYRAQTQVDTARGDVATYQQQVAKDENALTLLTGAQVPRDLLPGRLRDVAPPKEICAGLSSDVLLKRPDVAQAEAELKAAHAFVGAARSAFFPRISLTTVFGTASSELDGLFKAGSKAWAFAPQATMPLFDARTWSAYKVSKAQQKLALTQYDRTVQTAFREVSDALAVRGTVSEQVAAQQSLVNAVAETYRLSVLRYDKGIDSYLSVLDAQRSLYGAQQGLIALQFAKLNTLVQLYAVLGGGQQIAGEIN